jgi:MFS family permease
MDFMDEIETPKQNPMKSDESTAHAETGTFPRWSVLSVTSLGAFMVALDSNIVTIALPEISKALSAGYSLLSWVLAGYLISLAALLLQSGKLGDIYGKKRIYLIGFAIFGAASALCGLSPDAYQLVAYRIVQGVGASILLATGLPLVSASFPPKERGMALGVQFAAYAIGAVAGPVLGGALTAIDWRLIFFINVPISAVAVAIGRVRIPSSFNLRGTVVVKFNLVNAALLVSAVALVVLSLTISNSAYGLIGILALVVFYFAERKSSNAILNKDLLKTRGFVYSVIALSLLFVSYAGVAFVMSFYFQAISGFSPLTAGLWIAPLPIGLGIANVLAGELFDKMRRPALMSIAASILTAGSLLVLGSVILNSVPGTVVIVLLALIGFGSGFEWTPTITAVLKFAKAEVRGVASGTAYTVVQIAYVMSIALVVALSTASLPSTLSAQIRSGSIGGLSSVSAALFDKGLASAILGLAIVGFATLPFLILVTREQGRNS